jgi:hypothetical protein
MQPNRLVFSSVALLALGSTPAVHAAQVFVPIDPCRIVNTTLAGGPFSPGQTRSYQVVGTGAAFAAQGGLAGGCGLPTGGVVDAVAFNFFAVGAIGPGHLIAWASNGTIPNASALTYSAAAATGFLNVGNAVIVPVDGTASPDDLSVKAHVSSTGLIIDVFGYFKEVAGSTSVDVDDAPAGALTLAVAEAYALPQTCSDGQLPAWDDDGNWDCVTAGGGGDVTGITEGTGIAVTNPNDPAPTVGIAATYQLPQGCANDRLAGWNGASWVCATDQVGTGTLTGITQGTGVTVTNTNPAAPTVDVAPTYRLPQGCADGELPVWDSGTPEWDCVAQDSVETIFATMFSARITGLTIPPDSTNDKFDFGAPTGLSTAYLGANGGDVAASGRQTLASATACVARNLSVLHVDPSTGSAVVAGIGNSSRKVQLVVNATVTSFQCTIDEINSACSNMVDEVAVPAGARLAFRILGKRGDSMNAGDLLIGWECASATTP